MAAAGASSPIYVEDVFSTYLHTGTGTYQDINNDISLANGATNKTSLHLSDSLTDIAPIPSSITNVNGGVSVVSSPTKFGSGAFSFVPANNGWIYAVLSKQINIYGNFCIEFWQNSSAPDETTYVSGTVSNSSDQWLLRATSGLMRFWIGGTTYMTASLPTANQWNHIALTGDGLVVRLFYNGFVAASIGTGSMLFGGVPLIGGTPQLLFGASVGGGTKMNGYMDDIRVTAGRSVYTSNFTAPTAALPQDTLKIGYGGLVWLKDRGNNIGPFLYDTARGVNQRLSSSSPGSSGAVTDEITDFNSDGFSVGYGSATNWISRDFVSWTFRKAPKFFDIVTYTGNGSNNQIVNHSLGSTPGMIIVKSTDTGDDWVVYHQSRGYTKRLRLSQQSGEDTTDETLGYAWGTTGEPTANTFTVGDNSGSPSSSTNGQTYIAYLFANNAGGFGESGTDSVISCGSYTGDGGVPGLVVNVGFEPQWLMIKKSTAGGTGDWIILDSMRGVSSRTGPVLLANGTSGETQIGFIQLTSTGFQHFTNSTHINAVNDTYVYVAIRRPQKPTVNANSVFLPSANIFSTIGTGNLEYTPRDLFIMFGSRTSPTTPPWLWADRLRGYAIESPILDSTSIGQEVLRSTSPCIVINSSKEIQFTPSTGNMVYRFRRAPGFFDQVCWTGTGGARDMTHNLKAEPKLIIIKTRTTGSGSVNNWFVSAMVPDAVSGLSLESTGASGIVSKQVISATSSTISLWLGSTTNQASTQYTAYLFGSLPGISKVDQYTGNGSSQTINCGFSTGARFILIKRLDSTGNWYVWDTVRGIISANDPWISLNSNAAEVTTDDSIDPDNSGFIVNQVAATNINVTNAKYLYLAIA